MDRAYGWLTLGAYARVTVLCLSVIALAATYHLYEPQVKCYKTVSYSVFNVCIVWISLKTLCSPVLASFTSAFSTLSDEFSMDRMNNRDSDGFFSRRLVCRSSDSSYNSTGLSLVIANYQQRFLLSSCVSSCWSGIAWHTWLQLHITCMQCAFLQIVQRAEGFAL